MRKFISLILVMIMIVSFSACGNDNNTDNDTDTDRATSTIDDADNNASSSKDSDDKTEKPSIPAKSITVDDVKNHQASPESDFLCSDNGEGGLILVEYRGSDEIVVIPDAIDGKPIVEFREFVFANNNSIKGIKLSESVQTLGKCVFCMCPELEIVICGSGLKTIGSAAFQDCTSLKNIELNEGLERIDDLAFSYTESLKSVTIPESVTDLDNSFFAMSDDFKIIGKAGSAAETYANEASIPFQAN